MKSHDIESAVIDIFQDYCWFPQMRVGCGFGNDGERTMDLWGISPKRPFLHMAVEIKVSRNDFTRDLRSPLKQRRTRMLANQFYYAAPQGILKPEDMPIWAGLIEVADRDFMGNPGFSAGITHPAPWFDSSPATWSFVAHLARMCWKERDARERRERGIET